MLKSALAGVVLTLALLVAAAFALVESGYISANADAPPSRLETWMASASLDATLNREAPKEPNPVALTDENLVAGVHLFAQNCAVCHGDSRGLQAASPIAKGLYQKPPQMATDGVEDDPDGVSFWKIKHASGDAGNRCCRSISPVQDLARSRRVSVRRTDGQWRRGSQACRPGADRPRR